MQITGIVPEGTNSHTFEPKPSVAELLSTIDVLFVNGLKLEEPTKELAEQNMKDGADIVELGTKSIPPSEYAYDFSFPKSGGKPNPHLWTDPKYALQLRADRPRRPRQARPGERRLLRRELRRGSQAKVDAFDRGDAHVVRDDPARQAQAADLPRRLRVLRPRLRLGRHRRDPGLGLRGPDAEGGRGADRPGQARRRCRRSSAPRSSRAPCSSRSARRPACSTSTSCATTTCPASPATPSTRGWGSCASTT